MKKTKFFKRLLVLLLVFSMTLTSVDLGFFVSYAAESTEELETVQSEPEETETPAETEEPETEEPTQEQTEEPEEEPTETESTEPQIPEMRPLRAPQSGETKAAPTYVGTFSETKIHSAVYSETLGWKGRVFHWSIDGTPGLCLAKGVKTPANGTEMIRYNASGLDIRVRKALGWLESTNKNAISTLTAQFYAWAVQAGVDPDKAAKEGVLDYCKQENYDYRSASMQAQQSLLAIKQAKPAEGYVYKLPGYQDIYTPTQGHPPVEEPPVIPPENPDEPQPVTPEVLMIPREVSASYTIEVNKSCIETGNGLGDAVFDVLENGTVIGQITTDANGYGSYETVKTDSFEAYYCPNFAELTPEQQEMLSEMADGNEVFPGREEAEAFLDGLEEEFKGISYTYTVAENTARYGYVKHGVHPKDAAIPEKTIAGDETVDFDVKDHRTEGKIVVEKEDLETGKTPQGDATLAGAVYGLYAAAPIVHPDGHTGIVYGTNELTAIAATDKNGRLVFDTYTEGSFRTKPLLLGDYYVKEISRSEGYELSVSGINFPNTNFGAGDVDFAAAGGVVQPSAVYTAEADTDLYFHADKTGVAEGYTADITGVPDKTEVYAVSYHEEQREEQVLRGYVFVQSTDDAGNPLFETASGDEFKLDAEGNPVPAVDGDGNPILDEDGSPTFECYAEGEQMPVLEVKAEYETVTHTVTVEDRTPVAAAYTDGILSFESRNTGDGRDKYVLVLPAGTDAADLKENVLVQTKTTTSVSGNDGAGSYIKTITLSYPGQNEVTQDGGTGKSPIIVKERVIKQNLKIYKYISEDYKNNTWGVTVTNKLPDFFFKVYLVSDLEATGKLTKEADGTYDYEKFFEEYPEYADSLAVVCDKPEKDMDNDRTTIHASNNANESFWYAATIPLPYGRYVIVEQQPTVMPVKQYETAEPQEIMLPFIPQKGAADKQTPSGDYFYDSGMTMEEMQEKYGIRLGAENAGKYGAGETAVNADRYRDTELASYNGRYLAALVPWSVVEPGVTVINGTPVIQEENYDKFVGYAYKEFENHFYSSKLRIEKTDSETGENVLHDGAYFKIYKAGRDEATGDILLQDGKIVYDEKDLIVQYDNTGAEVGIFKAFSTIRELTTDEGIIKENVGYIETYQPLGAGTYVLVEISAPAGYVKSEPTAIEIYSDKVEFYTESAEGKTTAVIEQYAVPLTDKVQDVAVIEVKNKPIEGAVHKVEAGEETITFFVPGTEKELENREDIVRLVTAPFTDIVIGGIAVHTYDHWSEKRVEGSEEELLQMDGVRPVYADGTFAGYGVRYDVYVGNAELTLYEAFPVTAGADGQPENIVYEETDGKVTKAILTATGEHTIVDKVGVIDDGRVKMNEYDAVQVPNAPAEILVFDLADVKTETEDGLTYVLDERGNKTCLVTDKGVAYVLDADGTMLVYPVDEAGNKIVYRETEVKDGQIYSGLQSEKDVNGLPLYYTDGSLNQKDSVWNTPDAERKEPHLISRIPAGTYILEETCVPLEQGYIQAEPQAVRIKEDGELQEFFMEDDFTKVLISKLDLTGREEIPGAELTLYEAARVEDDSEQGYHLEKGGVYETWISEKEPHWIDHIPAGDYVLEETLPPYEAGYVKAEAVEIEVKETGVVQTFKMEDDHTIAELAKSDFATGEPVEGATLTLYRGVEQPDGTYMKDDVVLSWVTTSGKEIPEVDGRYQYEVKTGAGNLKYWITETGKLHLEYIPVGTYILEETITPGDYVTAEDVIVTIEDVGGTQKIQQAVMYDKAALDVEKSTIKETQCGDTYKYTLDTIANNTDHSLDEFTLIDYLPKEVILKNLWTGTFSDELTYSISYKTNKEDWRVWAENLSTGENTKLEVKDLGLLSDEQITEFKYEWGTVPAGFHEVKAPIYFVTVKNGLPANTLLINKVTLSGDFDGKHLVDEDETVTKIYEDDITETTPPTPGRPDLEIDENEKPDGNNGGEESFGGNNPGVDSPNTGDTMNAGVLAALIMCMMSCACGVVIVRRKKRAE